MHGTNTCDIYNKQIDCLSNTLDLKKKHYATQQFEKKKKKKK